MLFQVPALTIIARYEHGYMYNVILIYNTKKAEQYGLYHFIRQNEMQYLKLNLQS